MKSVYLVGGAGAGKSTMMQQVLRRLNARMGPLEDLHRKKNAKNWVTLRGHRLAPGNGIYLGCMRESFPGTDGLDRASSPAGAEWLEWCAAGTLATPSYILAEGATLATRTFIPALAQYSDLLLVHLRVDPLIADLRFYKRGSTQDATFVVATNTRSANLAREMASAGVNVLSADSSEDEEWDAAVDTILAHLQNEES